MNVMSPAKVAASLAEHVTLIERKSTKHTGNEVTGKTRSVEDPLRPL